MLKDLIRKRLLAYFLGSISVVLVNVLQSKLGLDPAQATDLTNKLIEALLVYVGGQSVSDSVAIYKGTKAN